MSQANRAIVTRRFDEVFTARNLDADDDIMTDRYVEHAVEPFGREEPGPVHGPSHAREVVAWLRAQFPDLEMTIESIVADTDLVAVRVRSAGTNLGKLGGFAPPTNKRFVTEQSHWYRVVDGKLSEHWATRDDLSAMVQLGVIHRPEPPPAGQTCSGWVGRLITLGIGRMWPGGRRFARTRSAVGFLAWWSVQCRPWSTFAASPPPTPTPPAQPGPSNCASSGHSTTHSPSTASTDRQGYRRA